MKHVGLVLAALTICASISSAQAPAKPGPSTVLECASCPIVRTIFPIDLSKYSEAKSPNGQYSIVGEKKDKGLVHKLFLLDNVRGQRRKLPSYNNRVTILWNSNSDFFSVTEYIDENHSRCTMMSVKPKSRGVGVIDVLSHQLTPDTWEGLKAHLGDQRFLVEGWAWQGDTALEATISTDASAFPTGTYIVLVPRASKIRVTTAPQ